MPQIDSHSSGDENDDEYTARQEAEFSQLFAHEDLDDLIRDLDL